MADNYLITGYWGEPHVTAENDRGINAAMFGAGRFVLPVGEQFRAEYIGNNTIRLYDGKLMNNGAAAGIPVGEYVDLLIANAGQGKKRNDLIVFQYSQDASTLIESGVFTVIKGTETSGTASDPALTQADLLSGEATFDQMALWRIPVSGTTISAPVKLFSVSKDLPGLKAWAEGELAKKAPAGYGLGEEVKFVSSIDGLLVPGQYKFYNGGYQLIAGVPETNSFDLEVISSGSGCIHRITTHTGGYRAERMYNGASWGELEWVNPPMTFGVEYRTTKRYLGKPVYTQMVGYGALPNNTGKNVSLSVATTVTNLVGYSGSAVFGSEASAAALDTLISRLELKYDGIVRIETDEERSGWSATFAIEYTKD